VQLDQVLHLPGLAVDVLVKVLRRAFERGDDLTDVNLLAHAGLSRDRLGTVCKILDQEEVKPHRVRYHLERRDPDFAEKMAEVQCVYRRVKIVKHPAIATTAPDLRPEHGIDATFAREHDSERHDTVSLLAGIDLVTGKVHALVKDRHRSREFIEFLELLDAAYPAPDGDQADPLQSFRVYLQKHQGWFADQPAHRFELPPPPSTVPGSILLAASFPTRPLRPAPPSRRATWTYKLDKAV
jgi:hypothetical protein